MNHTGKTLEMEVTGKRSRGALKKRWKDITSKEMKGVGDTQVRVYCRGGNTTETAIARDNANKKKTLAQATTLVDFRALAVTRRAPRVGRKTQSGHLAGWFDWLRRFTRQFRAFPH